MVTRPTHGFFVVCNDVMYVVYTGALFPLSTSCSENALSMCQLSGKGMTARCLALINQLHRWKISKHAAIKDLAFVTYTNHFFIVQDELDVSLVPVHGRISYCSHIMLLQLGEIVPQCACFLKL